VTELTGDSAAGPPPSTMSSAAEDGRLRTALAAAKSGGAILELGTGPGLGTAFLLAGMNAAVTPVTPVTVELSQPLSDIAREVIADTRAATWPTTCSRCRAWAPDRQASVDELVARLGALPGWHFFRMDHGSGVMVCTRSG
jgi:hypothetical protein